VFDKRRKISLFLIKPIQNDKVFNSTCKDKNARDVSTSIKINKHTGLIENNLNVFGEFGFVSLSPLWNRLINIKILYIIWYDNSIFFIGKFSSLHNNTIIIIRTSNV